MLVLKVRADGIGLSLGKVFHSKVASGAMPLVVATAQRQTGGAGMDQRVIAAEGIADSSL